MATDEELFAHATEEPPAETGQDEQQPVADQEEQPHQQETQETAPQETAPEPEAKKQQEQDHRVPLMELLNEREKRQTFERQIEEERRQRQALEQRIAEFQRQQQPKQELPDIFEDPNGFTETIEQRVERRLAEQEKEFSLRLAHRQYKDEFDTAYANLVKEGQINPSVVQSIVGSKDPGEALMSWHRQRTLYEKTGGDLDGYIKKREEELLKDPEFRKRFAETLRTESSQPQSGRPAPVVQIPPSLSKVSAAAPKGGDDDDMSDAGLFRHATRR